ncbi:MAG: hypothetical protein M5R42_08005 [Rhodocyclaceae bacterium]|nr:hypothetical protein [Rhodocyclaceae bacterium]
MKEIARAAAPWGSGAANEIPPKTVASCRRSSRCSPAAYTSFDLIALDAESLADPKHTP